MIYQKKSRSDDTLLTVDFNLRKLNDVQTLPRLAETALYRYRMASIVLLSVPYRDKMLVETIVTPCPTVLLGTECDCNRDIVYVFAILFCFFTTFRP